MAIDQTETLPTATLHHLDGIDTLIDNVAWQTGADGGSLPSFESPCCTAGCAATMQSVSLSHRRFVVERLVRQE